MAKKSAPSINLISKNLKKEKILPVYFLFGEDHYSLEAALENLRKTTEPLIKSDFDKEIINCEKNQSLIQILDLALTYPFGGGKKLIVIKNFEKLSDKKELIKYLENPPEFTVLIIINYGNINDLSSEPYSTLFEKQFIFEARNEKAEELIEWILDKANELDINFSDELARMLIEIVGLDKSILILQLEKIKDFKKNSEIITPDDLRKIASPTKQFTIFDLQDALIKGDKSKSIEIAYNLIDSNQEIVFIINMVAKFFVTLAQITELIKTKVSDDEGARMLGVSKYYYINCKKAKNFMSDKKLLDVSNALYNADLSVKTTNAESKTVLLVLISELLA